MTLAIVTAGAIAGSGTPSPAAPAMSPTRARQQQVDAASLTNGRSLFMNRCARCHKLPALGKYKAEDWPKIVTKMSKRSGLKAEQSKAVLAYILAARAAATR